MATYKVTVDIQKSVYDKLLSAFGIDDISKLSQEEIEKLGAWPYQQSRVYVARFDDGSFITYDICSGTSNYFDDVSYIAPDGRTETLECTFDIDDIEIERNGNTYIVELNIV